ncbi:hypothetical protein FSS13T_06570 [Flavobacterium saliperosum S13]|uniref:Signal peptidase I n=2 Tax=Flavobacterium saliperosum TaxID=329186 RepID=A0A1G4VA22_9FLAO|nr:DUF5684 domain-containing protein [Flavobacterium saliperosum]ESU28164.1 hypothetical protein FSS13T_06570 [Flavobacterium saliperosum S13]SCX03511.1 hypothetical protein SAMN02927925_00687 [Flavobacterium saliperosum]
MAAALLTILLFFFGFTLFLIICQWKVFTKAGKPGWACLIPIYSGIVLLEIIKKPIWWIFMLLIPIANIYFAIVITNELSKSFGKTSAFTVGLIFLPFIFYPILAFGDAKYIYNQTEEISEIGMVQA